MMRAGGKMVHHTHKHAQKIKKPNSPLANHSSFGAEKDRGEGRQERRDASRITAIWEEKNIKQREGEIGHKLIEGTIHHLS